MIQWHAEQLSINGTGGMYPGVFVGTYFQVFSLEETISVAPIPLSTSLSSSPSLSFPASCLASRVPRSRFTSPLLSSVFLLSLSLLHLFYILGMSRPPKKTYNVFL